MTGAVAIGGTTADVSPRSSGIGQTLCLMMAEQTIDLPPLSKVCQHKRERKIIITQIIARRN